MWVLPFLYYRHAYPLTTFYQEWVAALLSLLALPLLLSSKYWQRAELPRILLMPLGMIALILLQAALGRLASFDQALLLCSYFLWIAFLLMLGHALRNEFGLSRIVPVLAIFLLIGAELNALAGLIQHYRWHTFLNAYVTRKMAAAVYGNIAQPNHFADYLTLGLVSLGVLYGRFFQRLWLAALLAAPLLFVMVLSASRSIWLYLLFFVFWSYLWQRRDRAYRGLLHYSLLVLAGFVLMQFVVQLPWFASGQEVTTWQRTMEQSGSGGSSIRLYLWHEAWLIFTQFPLLGAGLGQFAWQHFQLGPALHDPVIFGLYNNAHNLVLQLAAETGLAGLAMVLGALGWWAWKVWRAPCSIETWWGGAVASVLCIHSMIEYPLWYGYFIGIAAVVLGMLESDVYKLKLRAMWRGAMVMMLLLCAMVLGQLWQSYSRLEEAFNLNRSAPDYAGQLSRRLAQAAEYPLLRPYADLFMSGMIGIDPAHLDDELERNERVLRFIPIASVAYREVWLLAQARRTAEAKEQLRQALWSYPADFPAEMAALRRFAANDPERFAALLEFAILENEEYQRAVLGK